MLTKRFNLTFEIIGIIMIETAAKPHEWNLQLPQINPDTIILSETPRHATIQDVNEMSSLINEFASARIMLARGPLYLYQSIQDYIVITGDMNGKDVVVACGGLHVLWEDLAEIRSVAVHPALQNRGLGKLLINALIENAKKIMVNRLFVFTLAPEFFLSLNFKEIPRDIIPPVVWAECSKCPKFYKCDEIGMMRPVEL